jgi:hypothetical protein
MQKTPLKLPLRRRKSLAQVKEKLPQADLPPAEAEAQGLAQAEARLKDEANRFLAKRRQNRHIGRELRARRDIQRCSI